MIGIDEVGRGCWAGPLLVVAARGRSRLPEGLKDSKKLSKLQRERLLAAIVASCDIGEGWVQPAEIDALGLTQAMKLGVERALLKLAARPEETILLDGNSNYCADRYTNVTCVVQGDDVHPIISAASIYAKVTRDTVMQSYAKQFPQYGFERHVGYGTRLHQEALNSFGITELHRRTFKPMRAFL